MKGTILLAAGVCLAVLVAGPAVNAAPDKGPITQYTHVHIGGALAHPPHVFTHEVWYQNIVYDASAKDPQYTSLDIYVNEPAPQGAAVMVWVHGGGMVMGDKAAAKDMGNKSEYFPNKLGYILVSVNYRLRPQSPYPVQEQDVAAAVAWVHDNIARFGGDPGQIFLMGHSAGATLVAEVATNGAFLEKAHKSLSILKGVIANEGSYGVVSSDKDAQLWESTYGAGWAQRVPVANVTPGKGIPPFLLLNVAGGSQLGANSEAQAIGLAKALQAANVKVTRVPLDHVEHFGANERLGQPGDITTASVEQFLGSIPGHKREPQWMPGTFPKM